MTNLGNTENSTEPMPFHREHHFHVSIAKFLFQHPQHGIVTVRDPIRLNEAKEYGLTPIILYSVSVARLPIRWITFSSVNRPRSLKSVLVDAWDNAEGLRGKPDILKVNHHIVTSSPELIDKMSRMGVQVEIAANNDKHFPTALRSAQDSSRWFFREYDKKNSGDLDIIQELCRRAGYDHNSRLPLLAYGGNRAVEEKIRRWLTLPFLKPNAVISDSIDWKPDAWLSSWEASLPPAQPRHFDFSNSYGEMWLLTGESNPDEDDESAWYDDNDNIPFLIRNIVKCWPNKTAAIAKSVGITLRELQWFMTEKTTLELGVLGKLRSLLSIEYSTRLGDYKCAGPYVLLANKPQALAEVYRSLSNGWDANSCEFVPDKGVADPSWRYVLINTYGESPSLVMVPRGSMISEQIPKLFMNYDGTKTVSKEFFHDVVSTCSKACREPEANIREMKSFVHRYETLWSEYHY